MCLRCRDYMQFCVVFRLRYLRFAGSVQAGENQLYNALILDFRRLKSQSKKKTPDTPAKSTQDTRGLKSLAGCISSHPGVKNKTDSVITESVLFFGFHSRSLTFLDVMSVMERGTIRCRYGF